MKLKKFGGGLVGSIGGGVFGSIAKEAQRGVRQVLPAVLGAGRRKCTSTHVQTDFVQESITLIVTSGGEVEIQEVTSPCADGNHNIVPCAQPLEIALNDGSYVFNDKFCTNCGEHFPFIAQDPMALTLSKIFR